VAGMGIIMGIIMDITAEIMVVMVTIIIILMAGEVKEEVETMVTMIVLVVVDEVGAEAVAEAVAMEMEMEEGTAVWLLLNSSFHTNIKFLYNLNSAGVEELLINCLICVVEEAIINYYFIPKVFFYTPRNKIGTVLEFGNLYKYSVEKLS
jgi:hypothetical protein